jgi:predicted aminopeptidase
MLRFVALFRRKVLQFGLLAGLAGVFLFLEGCYYMQAIRGHSDLMGRRRIVSEVIEDKASPEGLRTRLALVHTARDFSIGDLFLPDNESYRSYADLERDYVVWNVIAAPEFSLEPKTWCYPVAGCAAYRGYFSESSARELEVKLRRDGYDVIVGGVSAYSTLGRFPDPLLNTMMRWTNVDLVSTMFHELAHQKLYVKDDSTFNESFATTVADIGVERWLTNKGEFDRLTVYRSRKALRHQMMILVRTTRASLDALYGSDLSEDEMRRRKRQLLDALSVDAQTLVDGEDGTLRNWISEPLNNARLVSMSLYEAQGSAFRTLFRECNEQLSCFYERCEAVAKLEFRARRMALDALADRCRGPDC